MADKKKKKKKSDLMIPGKLPAWAQEEIRKDVEKRAGRPLTPEDMKIKL
jgi:hypothetical protein